MEIQRTRALRGPNIWADFPVAEVWLELSDILDEELSDLCRRVSAGIRALFPDCELPRRTTAKARPPRELWLARALERLILELSAHLGPRPAFSRVRPTPEAGLFQIAFDYREESLPRACAETALDILAALRSGTDCDLAGKLAALTASSRAERPSPTTAALLTAAQARGIPVRRLDGGVLQLGQGARQRLVREGRSEGSGPLSDWAAADRGLLRTLLAPTGVPCSDAPIAHSLYRLLVAGGRVVATLLCQGEGADGGEETATDLSDLLHPAVGARALDAAKVLRLDLAEIRLVTPDITRPLEALGGTITEVIPAPALDLYLAAAPGRPVAESLLDSLFPPGETGRIPVCAVSGTNGKTTVTRLLAHALGLCGRFVGMTCTDGIYLAGRRIDTDDCSGPQSARMVLLNPQVEAAVLETARGGILREGLGFDACDLAVITNIGEGDHLGLGGIETPEQLAEVKQTLVRGVAPWGTAVLNAADPLVARMAQCCKGRVLFFALDGGHPILARHRSQGGRVAFVRDQALVLAEGDAEQHPIPLGRIPLTHNGRIGFQVENVLACAGALWSLNLPPVSLRTALETFGADLDASPGRFNLLEINGARAVFDYGHNPSALLAMIDALAHLPHRRRIAVYSAAGDRRDADMIRQGEILGQAFDLVILYEDHYTRGRLPGEIMSLFRQGLAAGQRVSEVQTIHGWRNAVEAALWLARPGDVLLVQADVIDETVAYVRERLAADRAQRELPLSRAAAAASASADNLPQLAQA